MLAFDLLSVEFADSVACSGKVAFIDTSRIREKMNKAKRLKQGVQLLKDGISPGP
jgi:hypothetical protein